MPGEYKSKKNDEMAGYKKFILHRWGEAVSDYKNRPVGCRVK